MEIIERRTGNTVQLSLTGDLDIYGVAEVYARVSKGLDEADGVVLDLSAVDNIDGAGLQLLMAGKREAERGGKSLQLSQHSPCVIEAIELCQLERFFGDPLVLRPVGGRR